jgi:hypothetical protein
MYDILRPILFYILIQFGPSVTGIPTDSNHQHSKILAQEQISLEKRYRNEFVNDVFKDNILLNIAYLKEEVRSKEDINWDEINKPFSYKFVIPKGKTFAFHEDVFPEYEKNLIKTTNAKFNFDDGFKSSGYLYGDGVCHLASLMHMAAKNAGLDSNSPTRHDFAVIPEIPRDYGVSIYMSPGEKKANAIQNLYITNNKSYDIAFEFAYKDKILTLNVLEEKI